ncbi:MAG: hypothetical protein KGH77_03305 [Candidatus Micrarchaeota archaeon]|nr:hypothetical protein [Candidatus Micrarchaeota archaeon]MDE1864428.1 hypothetical protein [Candidatus Micrarchaeota archaeon]
MEFKNGANQKEAKNIEFKDYIRVPLGRPAVFYLPSIKINDPKSGNLSLKIHNFLIENFGGYTAEKGSILGYWQDNGSTEYNENIKYTIAFEGKHKIPVLEKFLAEIADKISEKAVYLETGEDSWLIYPKRR